MIIPSIDLMNGKLVQMEQGRKVLFEIENPIEIAKKYSKYCLLQVIDIDAVFDK